MTFRAKLDFHDDRSCHQLSGQEEVLQFLSRISWEDEYAAGEEEVHFPSIDIMNEVDRKLLTITALDCKPEARFTVECRNAGRLARGTTGTLVNNATYARVVEITRLYCECRYQEIELLDNGGMFSKFLRKIIFLFASDADDEFALTANK